MTTIGRNDPCPCGSGKKYKKCCGAITVPNAERAYDNVRRLETECADLLAAFARVSFGKKGTEEALENFGCSGYSPLEEKHPENEYFARWFIFDSRRGNGDSLPELFLASKGSTLDPTLRRFLQTVIDAPYSFYQVLEVEAGSGLKLRDIMRKKDFDVTERIASTIIEKSHLMFARVVEFDDVTCLMGNGGRVLPAAYLNRMIYLRTTFAKQNPAADGTVSTETLLHLEEPLRRAYFSMTDTAQNQPRDLRNTDGDPLERQTKKRQTTSFASTSMHSAKNSACLKLRTLKFEL